MIFYFIVSHYIFNFKKINLRFHIFFLCIYLQGLIIIAILILRLFNKINKFYPIYIISIYIHILYILSYTYFKRSLFLCFLDIAQR